MQQLLHLAAAFGADPDPAAGAAADATAAGAGEGAGGGGEGAAPGPSCAGGLGHGLEAAALRAAVWARLWALLPLLPVVLADAEPDRRRNLRAALARALLQLAALPAVHAPCGAAQQGQGQEGQQEQQQERQWQPEHAGAGAASIGGAASAGARAAGPAGEPPLLDWLLHVLAALLPGGWAPWLRGGQRLRLKEVRPRAGRAAPGCWLWGPRGLAACREGHCASAVQAGVELPSPAAAWCRSHSQQRAQPNVLLLPPTCLHRPLPPAAGAPAGSGAPAARAPGAGVAARACGGAARRAGHHDLRVRARRRGPAAPLGTVTAPSQ